MSLQCVVNDDDDSILTRHSKRFYYLNNFYAQYALHKELLIMILQYGGLHTIFFTIILPASKKMVN